MNKKFVGDGNVYLIAGGNKIYTDIAARFVKSEKPVAEIIASDYDAELVERIVNSGHLATTEFDYFLFGIEGYARVTEIQLVRKRLASYLIKSGRVDKKGKRNFDIVIPQDIENFSIDVYINGLGTLKVNSELLLNLIEIWYDEGIKLGKKEEDLRYLKPQATEFKAIIGMNAHALLDWFQVRCCLNAQTEIRDLANKMLKLCKDAAPDLFINAGSSCKVLGYCPENNLQNKKCKNKIYTKEKAIDILKKYKETEEKEVN